MSIKKKPEALIREDYARSVVGMAFYFSSIVFNISPAIRHVEVCGYTQRLNKKNGKVEDQYVYAIAFERGKFSSLNIPEIDPLEAVDNFTRRLERTAKFELKTIDSPDL